MIIYTIRGAKPAPHAYENIDIIPFDIASLIGKVYSAAKQYPTGVTGTMQRPCKIITGRDIMVLPIGKTIMQAAVVRLLAKQRNNKLFLYHWHLSITKP